MNNIISPALTHDLSLSLSLSLKAPELALELPELYKEASEVQEPSEKVQELSEKVPEPEKVPESLKYKEKQKDVQETKTIQIISDAHTEFNVSPDKFRLLLDKADITVLAGDIVNRADKLLQYLLVCKEFSEHIVYICGNHEYYKGYTDDDYRRVCDSVPNVTFLQRDRVNVNGLWFSGCTLWTNVDDYASRSMNDPFDASTVRLMHQKDVEWLTSLDSLTSLSQDEIIVTHHLPSLQLIHPKYKFSYINSGFATNLDWLIDKIKPSLWICGHTHSRFDTMIEKVRVVVNPVGYPGENATFSKKIVEL